jgi:glycosyltransferase involved in cell wall biosynthesis
MDIVDEIVIIDNESTDGSDEIVKRHGAKVYKMRPLGFVEPCRVYALSKITHNWFLYLDADERLNTELKRDLRRIVRVCDEKGIAGIAVNIKYFVKPDTCLNRYTEFNPNFRVRIARKDKTSFTTKIHTDPIINGRVLYLDPEKYFIKHLAFNHFNLSRGAIEKHVRYAKIAAEQRRSGNEDVLFLVALPITIALRLFKELFLKKAALEGPIGFKLALTRVLYLSLIDIFKVV